MCLELVTKCRDTQACLQPGRRKLPFPNARQLLDLRHDLSYFELQPLKEEGDIFHMQRKPKETNKNPQFSTPYCNGVLMKNGRKRTDTHLNIIEKLSLPAPDV